MNLYTVFTRFPDQHACVAHLEAVRWGDKPTCPFCTSTRVARKAERDRIGRWNCHACKSSFNVLSGTIFEKTRIPLQKWFVAISLLVNAKKSLSSYQLSRDLDLNQPSAWYMQQRIRAAMHADHADLLQGIIEADETYVEGRPRRTNKAEHHTRNKRGRGTKKTPVVGAVERGGKVRAKVSRDLTGKGMVQFVMETMDTARALLMTDEYPAYNLVESFMPHAVINHSREYVNGEIHTNTIEGFWALLKRSWYDSHHHYTPIYMPLYVAEACWKYNARKDRNPFGAFVQGCFPQS